MITPKELREWREENHLSQSEAALILGVKYQQRISEFENGTTRIPQTVDIILTMIKEQDADDIKEKLRQRKKK